MFYIHLRFDTGARLSAEYSERAAYIVSGAVEVEGQALQARRMLIFRPNGDMQFTALMPSTVMLLGGEPVGPDTLVNMIGAAGLHIEMRVSNAA